MNISLKSIALIAISALTLSSCVKDDDNSTDPKPSATTNEMHFMVHNYFGNDEIVLNTGTYTNQQNEQLSITTFNYWITNIKFVKSDGSEYVEPNSYRLIRGDQSSTMHFHVEDVPAGTYTGVKFMVGVDVEHSTTGAQDGALDPAVNGDMFWSWNTGYIQVKMEGTSPVSTATDNVFKYHIGGVGAGTETPREVSLTFPSALTIGDQAGSVHMKTDAAKFFGPGTAVSIAAKAILMAPGQEASNIADNYAQMFSITSVGNQ